MNDGPRYRVRPWLRTVAIVALVFLTPIATHAIWDLIEARRLSAVVEGLRARGEMVYWSTWRPGTPSPEEKAAARHYTAAAVLVRDAWPLQFREINNIIDAIAASPPREAARDPRLDRLQPVLDEYAPALDLLDRASAFAGVAIRPADELRYPVLPQNLANVNAVRIARLSFLGKATDAANALSEILTLPRMPSLWPVGVDTSRSLRLLLMFAPPDAARLAQLQQEYARLGDDKQVESALIESRARLITGAWPAASGPMAAVPRLGRIGGGVGSVSEVVLRPLFTRQVARSITEYDEALSVARQPWPAKLDMAIASTDKVRESSQKRGGLQRSIDLALGNLAVNSSASQVSILAKRAANDAARQRAAVAVLAIERFRRAHANALPADLAALVPQYLDAVPIDPFTGTPLKFTRSDQGYKVYSVGLNRTDEGGDWSDDVPRHAPAATTSSQKKDIGIDIRKF